MYGDSRTDGGLHWVQRTKAFATTVLPLVFDNSLSYMEMIGRFSHKLNECIDAINAQNLNLIEFCHMVEVEVERFEKYIDDRITDFESGIRKEWEDYKTALNSEWDSFKQQMLEEWEQEKQLNENFRNQLTAAFQAFKTDINNQITGFENLVMQKFEEHKTAVNDRIDQFEATVNGDITAFKQTMQTQQNEFENHMVELFTDFTTDQSNEWSTFQANFQKLFDQWKVDTLNAIQTQLTQWQTQAIADLKTYIDSEIGGFEASIRTEITNLSHSLSQEADARQQADSSLQRQINELTPTGSIKADIPDQQGNSQLYIVNPDTSEREDIFPKTKASGSSQLTQRKIEAGGNTYSYVLVFTNYNTVQIHLTNANFKAGVTDLGNIIKIPVSDLSGSTIEQKMTQFKNSVQASQTIIADGDYNNSFVNANPLIAFHTFFTDNTYAYVSVKVKLDSELTAIGNEDFWINFSVWSY